MSRRGRHRGDEADADGFTSGFDMVINVPGTPGDSDLEGHNQWINVLAWSWGLSRGDKGRKKPARILKAIAAKKKEIVNEAMQAIKQKKQADADKKKTIKTAPPENADGNGQQIEKKIEETLNKQMNGSADNVQHEAGAQAPAAVADDSGDDVEPLNEYEIAEEALADYDSDNDDDNQFDESEMRPRRRAKPSMRNLSVTKYVDIASPLLMLKCLSKKTAFDCTLRICKRREIKKPKDEVDLKSASTQEKEKSEKKKAVADVASPGLKRSGRDTDDAKADEAKEEKKEFESIVLQEFVLQDCYIQSVRSGGSGGQDRFTENITIKFSRVILRQTDHLGFAPRGSRDEIPTTTVYYDSLRHKAMALDQTVANVIEDGRKLAPASTVLMDSLNLTSKPNTSAL